MKPQKPCECPATHCQWLKEGNTERCKICDWNKPKKKGNDMKYIRICPRCGNTYESELPFTPFCKACMLEITNISVILKERNKENEPSKRN